MSGTAPDKRSLGLKLRAVWIRWRWPEKERNRVSQGRGVPRHDPSSI